MFHNSKIQIIQLAKSWKDYIRPLNQPFFKENHYFDNKEIFKNFLKKFSEKELTIKPKCIIIGTKFLPHTFNYYNKLYLDTLFKIKKKYSYTPDEILFFHIQERKKFI